MYSGNGGVRLLKPLLNLTTPPTFSSTSDRVTPSARVILGAAARVTLVWPRTARLM